MHDKSIVTVMGCFRHVNVGRMYLRLNGEPLDYMGC